MANNKFFDKFLNIFFPADIKCVVCGEEIFDEELICERCQKKLPRIEKHCLKCGMSLKEDGYCDICKNRERYFSYVISPFEYKREIVKLVRNYKYDGRRYLAKSMAYEMVKKFKEYDFKPDIIAFIPLHPKRQKERGYNQAELIADYVSEMLNIPISKNNFIKTLNTKSQTRYTYVQRKYNVENSFKIENKDEFKGKKILLIDDVITTGATLEIASHDLLEAGAKEVVGLTFAHTINFKKDDIEIV